VEIWVIGEKIRGKWESVGGSWPHHL